MTPARFLREEALRALRDDVPKNLNRYRSGDFEYLDTDPTTSFSTSLTVDMDGLGSLTNPSGQTLFEAENCAIVLKALPALTPYDARDERLWTHLSHTVALSHARLRWEIPKDDGEAIKHIHKHFFARDKRQIERDNVVSRLWWMGHLCDRIDGIPLNDALETFLYRSDVRANIIERPTVSQAKNVFSAILKKLMQSKAGAGALFERKSFRALMMELNSVGGVRLLDCLPQKQVEEIVDHVVGSKLGIKVV